MATGGRKAMLSGPVQNYANEIAQDEINHVSSGFSNLRKYVHSLNLPGRPLIQCNNKLHLID